MIKLLSKVAIVMFRKKLAMFRKKLANSLIFLGDMLAVWNFKEYK